MTRHAASIRSHTTAPLTEARERLSEILDDVMETGSDLVITRHGRPAAVVMAHDDYEALLETLNILSNAETMSAIAEAETDIANGDLEDLD